MKAPLIAAIVLLLNACSAAPTSENPAPVEPVTRVEPTTIRFVAPDIGSYDFEAEYAHHGAEKQVKVRAVGTLELANIDPAEFTVPSALTLSALDSAETNIDLAGAYTIDASADRPAVLKDGEPLAARQGDAILSAIGIVRSLDASTRQQWQGAFGAEQKKAGDRWDLTQGVLDGYWNRDGMESRVAGFVRFASAGEVGGTPCNRVAAEYVIDGKATDGSMTFEYQILEEFCVTRAGHVLEYARSATAATRAGEETYDEVEGTRFVLTPRAP